MPVQKQKNISFSQYKALKDDIIEISEQKFENRLNQLEKRIIDSIETKIDIKISPLKTNIDSLRSEMRWLIGILFAVLTIIMTLFKFLK